MVKIKFMHYLRLLSIVIICYVASCTPANKLAKTPDDDAIDLDTIEVTASRKNPYRESAPRDFDLVHTKLEVSFNYDKQYLYGKATITLKPHFYPQSTLTLDAKNFEIQEVSIIKPDGNREPVSFTYDSLQMKIQLGKTYTRDEKLNVFVYYTAKPNENKMGGGSAAITDDKGLYFINPKGEDSTKPVQIWTQGETESNSHWFPTIDKPNQKMTDEIYITHLKKYVSLSNGILVSSKDNGDSTVTDYWKMNLPHAPYLVMMAVGDFAIINERWRDVPVSYYVEKAYEPYAKKVFGNTPEMVEFFSQKLNFEFPWPKYAQIVVRDYVSGAMENTTATLHGEFLNRNSRELLDETHEDVISHELFHQWFGDLVTTESWSNIPLNESFATYGEYLWNEYKYGREYADYKLLENYDKYLEEVENKNVDLIRFQYNDREDMFDRHSYEKGGLLLHYLRYVVGDEAFFKSLELYLKTNQFKPVEVHQLRLAFEEVTGKDMNWFFNQWFLNAGHPQLGIIYTSDADSVYVTINQQHNIEKPLVYILPMEIAVYYGNRVETYPVRMTEKTQTFAFKASGTPDLIDADAQRVVLCEKTENKTVAQYIFQYNHAPLFTQRYEALLQLGVEQKTSPGAAEALKVAMRDSFFYIRQIAIEMLELPKAGDDSVAAVLAMLAKTDNSSHVRAAAIDKLSKLPSVKNYAALFENAVGDSSYSVVGSALSALYAADAKKAMEVAKQFENEDNSSVAIAIADIYSTEGDAEYRNYFKRRLHVSQGINRFYLFYYYANFLTRMDKNTVLAGIGDIEEEGKLSLGSHYVTSAAKGSLKRISKWFDEKRKRVKNDLSKEEGQTAKIEMMERLNDYDAIISEVTDALSRLNKAAEAKKAE